jgi:hypothetical protein
MARSGDVVSNRPNYTRRRRNRRLIGDTLTLMRAVHGCDCQLEIRHRDTGANIGHDDGCSLIGRRQIIIDVRGHR